MLRARVGLLLTFTLTLVLLLAIGRPAYAATITVTNTADSGPGSLRQALVDAASGDTIDFALNSCPCTITLTSGELVIDENLTIIGAGATQLTVSGGENSRVFHILPGVVAELAGLQISHGSTADYLGGGIHNQGNLTVRNSMVVDNHSVGLGGGISSAPGTTLWLITTTVSRNGANVYGGGGVALAAGVSATIIGTTIADNTSSRSGGGIDATGATLMLVNSTIFR